jgi:branched-chain amino acid transport system ATP-binding protein
MSLLEVVNLSKHFGNLLAVDDISFTVEEGEIRGLIGPNGAGKTTLFSLISGFLQPTKGKILWKGEDLAGMLPNVVVKKGICRTFQLTTLFKELTALQNVIMGCHLHTKTGLWQQFWRTGKTRKREREIEEKAIGLLETLGIADVKDRFAGDLPHGHQRILGLAIALASEPELLMLDEPVSGMNPTEKATTMEVVRRLHDKGITIFVVEHDMKAVMSTCDKVTVMSFGKKIAEGCPEEVCNDEAVIEAYLGAGYNHA